MSFYPISCWFSLDPFVGCKLAESFRVLAIFNNLDIQLVSSLCLLELLDLLYSSLFSRLWVLFIRIRILGFGAIAKDLSEVERFRSVFHQLLIDFITRYYIDNQSDSFLYSSWA